MKSFSDFNIEVTQKGFTGDKIKIDRVLNLPITVVAFKIVDSKFDGKCLHLQIKKGDTEHVVFTGSSSLMELIQKVSSDGFPFQTTILKKDERFLFT